MAREQNYYKSVQIGQNRARLIYNKNLYYWHQLKHKENKNNSLFLEYTFDKFTPDLRSS